MPNHSLYNYVDRLRELEFYILVIRCFLWHSDEISGPRVMTGLELEDRALNFCTLLGACWETVPGALTASALPTAPLPLPLLQPSLSRVVTVKGGKRPELQGAEQGKEMVLKRGE